MDSVLDGKSLTDVISGKIMAEISNMLWLKNYLKLLAPEKFSDITQNLRGFECTGNEAKIGVVSNINYCASGMTQKMLSPD